MFFSSYPTVFTKKKKLTEENKETEERATWGGEDLCLTWRCTGWQWLWWEKPEKHCGRWCSQSSPAKKTYPAKQIQSQNQPKIGNVFQIWELNFFFIVLSDHVKEHKVTAGEVRVVPDGNYIKCPATWWYPVKDGPHSLLWCFSRRRVIMKLPPWLTQLYVIYLNVLNVFILLLPLKLTWTVSNESHCLIRQVCFNKWAGLKCVTTQRRPCCSR